MMQSFKQFFEATVEPYKQVDKTVDQLLDFMDQHCTGSINAAKKWGTTGMIWRGSRSNKSSGIANPGSGERSSQNTSNFYTKFLDTNPKNSHYPPRAKSFIGSTNRERAGNYTRGYGTLLALFPTDGHTVGIVNTDDIWDVDLRFYGNRVSIADMNEFWSEFYERGRSTDNVKVPSSLEIAIADIKNADPDHVIKCMKRDYIVDQSFEIPPDKNKFVNEFADSLMIEYSYDKMGCKLVQPNKVHHHHSEVWFTGACAMVSAVDLPTIAKEFGFDHHD